MYGRRGAEAATRAALVAVVAVLAAATAAPPWSRGLLQVSSGKTFDDILERYYKPGELFEGDIRLTRKMFVVGRQRNAVNDAKARWPKGVVPYEIDTRYDASEKSAIMSAMKEISSQTCVKFRPADFSDFNFVYFDRGFSDACETTGVGFLDEGEQAVRASGACLARGPLLHELMHVLGFLHEHSRPDRDQHVRVFFSNIPPLAQKYFEKYSSRYATTLGQPYDFSSVMHYGAHQFAADPARPTLATLPPGRPIGQRLRLSGLDVLKLNKYYNCPQL